MKRIIGFSNTVDILEFFITKNRVEQYPFRFKISSLSFSTFLSLNIRRDFSCLDKQVFSQENFCEKQIDGEETPE